MPQLLKIFDELANRDNGSEHKVLSSCNISADLQERLGLVPVTNRIILSQFCNDMVNSVQHDDPINKEQESEHEKTDNTIDNAMKDTVISVTSLEDERNDETSGKPIYYERRENNALTPLRYSRRCRKGSRPVSGSSIASSTSSSCSNQGTTCTTCTTNPYLASVESLADTCASSQGSADSGIATMSETGSRILNDDNDQSRDSIEEKSFHMPRYCDPERSPVERVLLEIVDTEAIYVDHLRQVIEGYLIFWKNDPMSYIHRLFINELFSNIEAIYKFNSEFLLEIEKCGLDPVRVANTFVQYNSGFKVYTEYCTNYPTTISTLTNLLAQETTASAFRERQAALGHELPLGSFLLKPVQRILKYHLLLQNLSKVYDADCDSKENEAEGRSAIEAALVAMTDIAKHINDMKKRHEHAVRVQEIQSLLYGWLGPDLTRYGELIAEGQFRMRGAKGPRHVFLFDRMIFLTKKKEDGFLVYKAHIMVR